MIKILWLLSLCSSVTFSQTKFTSTKFNYSFIYPDGWHVNDKIYNPEVDAKIVDGEENSFIVSVKIVPHISKFSAVQELSSVATQEIEQLYSAVYGTSKIAKRGTFYIDFREFYFLHLLTPYKNGLQLYHKQFTYYLRNSVITIDACSIESYLDETTPAFAIMLDTFKFGNLSKKN